jgi:hypothetical protein
MNGIWAFASGALLGLLLAPIVYLYLAVNWSNRRKTVFFVMFSLGTGLAALFGWSTR